MTLNSHDQLIRGLAAELQPVQRLPPPLFRVLVWLAVVVALAIVPAAFANLDAVWQRIRRRPCNPAELHISPAGQMPAS